MKKVLYLVAVAATMFLASCQNNGLDVDDPNEYCWELNISMDYMGVKVEKATYAWGTAADLQEEINAAKAEAAAIGATVSISSKKSNITSADACLEKIFGEDYEW